MAKKYWNSVEVYLVSGGERLPVYPNPDPEDVVGDVDKLCYVEAITGQTFEIAVRFSKAFVKYGAKRIDFKTYMDGAFMDCSSTDFRDMKKGKHGSLVQFIAETSVWDKTQGLWRDRGFKFAQMIAEEHDGPNFDPANTTFLGSIKLVLTRTNEVEGSAQDWEPDDYDPNQSIFHSSIAEKALKGRDITNRICLGDVSTYATYTFIDTRPLSGPKGGPYVVELRYRTRSQLQALGCLPPDQDTIALEGAGIVASPPLETDHNNPLANSAQVNQGGTSQADRPAASQETTASSIVPAAQGQAPLRGVAPKVEPRIKTEEALGTITEEPQQHQDSSTPMACEAGFRRPNTSQLRSRLDIVKQELALVREQKQLEAEIAAATKSMQNGGVSSEGSIGRKRTGAGQAVLAPKRIKKEVVDLTDDD